MDALSRRLVRVCQEIESAENTEAALHLFQDAYGIDFVTYHLSQIAIDMVDNPFVRTTYHAGWVSRYLLRGYVSIDPVVRQGFLRQFPFDWRDIEIMDADKEFLSDAIRHGVGLNGFSIPIVDKSRRALLSLNSHGSEEVWSKIVSSSLSDWLELAHLIHAKALVEAHGSKHPTPLLSPRELECLHWSALGNDAKGISMILGLSEHTTRAYIKSARFKLGCVSTTAAAVRAVHLRLINPYGNTPR